MTISADDDSETLDDRPATTESEGSRPTSTTQARALTDEALAKYMVTPERKVLNKRDWRSEVFYFLLPDRFNAHYPEHFQMPAKLPVPYWNLWAMSGRNRFQGGNIVGIIDQLPYLTELGITALWIGPVWKQRVAGLDRNVGDVDKMIADPLPPPDKLPLPEFFAGATTQSDEDKAQYIRDKLTPSDYYHGYSIQDFLTVDQRFGTVDELRELVHRAHDVGIRVIFDIVINHSGENWLYDTAPLDTLRPPFLSNIDPTADPLPPFGARYPFASFLDVDNHPMPAGQRPSQDRPDDGIWPTDFQDPDMYNRRGFGDYSQQDYFGDHDEIRVADWMNRDFRYDAGAQSPALKIMLDIWKYWIAITDCDGFRVDTFKHVPLEISREFTQEIRKWASRKMGKGDFFVVGEIGGDDVEAAHFLNYDPGNLRTLEVGQRRDKLRQLARGQADAPPADQVLLPTLPNVPAQLIRNRVMTSIDDHDNVGTQIKRFAADPPGAQAVVPAVALLLFGPGIPSVYYGTEQGLSGPELAAAGDYLKPEVWGIGNFNQAGDRYLREAMFAPVHPRLPGVAGLAPGGFDSTMPGFSPGGPDRPTRFDTSSDIFIATSSLIKLRTQKPTLWSGRLDVCAIARPGGNYVIEGGQTMVAWTRKDTAAGFLIVIDTRPDAGPPRTSLIQLPPNFTGTTTLFHQLTVGPIGPLQKTTVNLPQKALAATSSVQTNQLSVEVVTSPGIVRIYSDHQGPAVGNSTKSR